MEFQQVITTNIRYWAVKWDIVLSTYVEQFPWMEKHIIVFFIGMCRGEYCICASASLFGAAKHRRLQSDEFIAAASSSLVYLL